jgi:ADP-ribosyl-[dinitrogen reductase] hydrolase
MMAEVTKQKRMRGVMLGTAVGDAVGLPAEGLSRRRIARLFRGRWRHRLIGRYGMLSDDTEHTLFIGQALLAHPDSLARFSRRLAWSLRGWLLSLPAGIGMATGRAIIKLWLGFPPHKSGVWSAGNGAAMRVAPIGACFAADSDKMKAYVHASTIITHSDPRAEIGALAVARVVGWCFVSGAKERINRDNFFELLRTCGDDTEWSRLLDKMALAIVEDKNVEAFADALGQQRGVSGYVYHTVPVALYAWYRHFGDFEATLSSVFNCGGDTDTVGAIAGAMSGAVVGEQGIPADWVDGIVDWPRNVALLRGVADRLAEGTGSPVSGFWPAVLPRNLMFLFLVLLHGFRRMLPPY